MARISLEVAPTTSTQRNRQTRSKLRVVCMSHAAIWRFRLYVSRRNVHSWPKRIIIHPVTLNFNPKALTFGLDMGLDTVRINQHAKCLGQRPLS